MRNILHYPITLEEVIQTLENAIPKYDEHNQPIGGTQDVIIADIISAAKTDPQWFYYTFKNKIGYKL